MSYLNSLNDILILEENEIGSGGYGKVFKVLHKKTDKVMALKHMDIISFDNSAQDGLRNEIAIHSGLNHKNVIKYYDSLQIKNYVFILTEYANKGNLKKICQKNKICINLALDYFIQIAEGVKYLHKQKIMHRDIKLENILVTETGQIKICDFGMSEYVKTSNLKM